MNLSFSRLRHQSFVDNYKSTLFFLSIALVLTSIVFSTSAIAQTVPVDNAKAAEALKGVWIIKIGNEPRTRTLVVGTKVTQENDETTIDGQWGFSDGNLVGAKITVSVIGGKPQGKVATPSPTAFDFEMISVNSLEGRWLNRNGKMLGSTGQRFDPMAQAQSNTPTTLANKPIAFELKDSAAQLPDLKAGDIWRYVETDQRTNVKTRDVERRLVSFANGRWAGTENGGSYNALPNLSLIDNPNVRTTSGERTDFVFPLKTGAQWPVKYSWSNLISGNTGGFDGQAQVLSYEKITTPAGEFDAFKVEIKGFWTNANSQSGRSTETLWYSPAVRNYVQRDYSDGFSMARYVLVGFNLTP
jgi:hypothetical protein